MSFLRHPFGRTRRNWKKELHQKWGAVYMVRANKKLTKEDFEEIKKIVQSANTEFSVNGGCEKRYYFKTPELATLFKLKYGGKSGKTY